MARKRRSKRRKFGVSWSWKRAVGISAMKGKIARKTGIPLTRAGRQRKLGGCLMNLLTLGLLNKRSKCSKRRRRQAL